MEEDSLSSRNRNRSRSRRRVMGCIDGNNNIVVVVDANKEVAGGSPLEWTLHHLARRGDHVTLLGILHKIANPMGYKTLANSSIFNGTNRIALEQEIIKKMDSFEEKLRFWSDVCDKKGIFLDIKITAGTPFKVVVLKEAQNLQASFVILDRHLKKEKRFYRDQLLANVFLLRKDGQAEFLRGLDGPCESRERSEHSSFSSTCNRMVQITSGTDSRSTSSSNSVAALEWQMFIRPVHQDAVSLLLQQDVKYSEKREMMQNLDGTLMRAAGNEEEEEEEEGTDDARQINYPGSRLSSPLGSISRRDSLIHTTVLDSPCDIVGDWLSPDSSYDVNSPFGSTNSPFFDNGKTEALNRTHTMSMNSPESSRCISIEHRPPLRSECLTASSSVHCLQSFPVSVQPRRSVPVHLLELFKGEELFLRQEPGEGSLGLRNWSSDPETMTRLQDPRNDLKASLMTAPLSDDLVVHQFSTKDDGSGDKPKSKETGYKLFLKTTLLERLPPLCSKCNQKSPSFNKPPCIFTRDELIKATNNFSPDNVIAEGGFGLVYKGVLEDGQKVAVKRLKVFTQQGDKQFLAEVNVLTCARHCNLVTLLGHYTDSGDCALVYEYVCNGSLDCHLSGKSRSILQWSDRQRIALGAARALRYLHEECRVGCIVHRDVRPRNILLTHDFTPMVGDFGLARLQQSADTPLETHVLGSLGYIAPEYAEFGQITDKIDVYAFGVVLLELISGRKAVDQSRVKGEQFVIEWAKPKLERKQIYEVLDPRLGDSFNPYELHCMVNATLLCTQKDPSRRPRMSQVIRLLEGEREDLRKLSINIPHSIVGEKKQTNYFGEIEEVDESGHFLQKNGKIFSCSANSSFGSKRSTQTSLSWLGRFKVRK